MIVPMSMHKFASNVIEKCLAHGNTLDRDLMVRCMLAHREPQLKGAFSLGGWGVPGAATSLEPECA